MLKPIERRHWGYGAAAHLLNRAGFGGPPSEIESLARLRPEDAVERLMDFGSGADPEAADDDAEGLTWARPDADRVEKLRRWRQASEEERRRWRQEEQREQRRRAEELRGWWLRRMVSGRRPLEEKLVLFWHGHFATSLQKVRDPRLMYQQLATFRRQAAGSWRELLLAVARDSAMLLWLDQARSRRERPNENFARELLELFTLGEGNYSETDIREAARALTGLGYDPVHQESRWRPGQHDQGSKTFLGHTGNLGPEDVVDRILIQPQAARHIMIRLWSFFAGEPRSTDLMDALAREFRAAGCRFRPVLRRMFLAEEFHSPEVVRSQIKSPVQWLVAACRQLERPLPATERTTAVLRRLGQDLLAPPNVKGWEGGMAWINTSTLPMRQALAGWLMGEPLEGGEGRGRAADGADRSGRGMARLFEEADLRDRECLSAALARRFLQTPFRERLGGEVREALGEDRMPGPGSIARAVRVVLGSTDYQLT